MLTSCPKKYQHILILLTTFVSFATVGVLVCSKTLQLPARAEPDPPQELVSIPQTCPATSCNQGYTCKDGNCVQRGDPDDIFPPIEESSFREYAARRGIIVGTSSQLSKGTLHKDVLAKEFNAAVIPNYMKFVMPKRDEFNLATVDNHTQFARENNMRLEGVSLVYKDKTTPEWLGFYDPETGLSDPDCGGWAATDVKRQELDDLMKNFIQTLVSYGGDDVYIWKVVNEPLSQMGKTCWSKVLGEEEYIAKAFRYAYEANPNTLLMINDTFGQNGIDRTKTDTMIALIKRLKGQGVPIHVVGIELHLEADGLKSNYGNNFVDALREDFVYFLEEAKETGVQVHVSEMDVYQGPEGYFNDPFEVQKQVFKTTMATCLEYTHCTGFFTWGVTDKYTWLHTQGKSLPNAQPLLFDENYQRKPAYYGVAEALKENTTRACVLGDANGDGVVNNQDLELLKQDYLGQPVHNTDFNSDGRVDSEDFAILQANYLK